MTENDSPLELAGSADYYIRDVDLSVDPKVGSNIHGSLDLELEMMDPELEKDELRFTSEGELEMTLTYQEMDMDDPSEYGSVIVHFVAVVEPDLLDNDEERQDWLTRAQDSVTAWETEGYESIDPSLKFELESELFSELLVPIANLLDSQFSGIMPRVVFGSQPTQSDGEIDREQPE